MSTYCASCGIRWDLAKSWEDHSPVCANARHGWAFTVKSPSSKPVLPSRASYWDGPWSKPQDDEDG